MCVWCVTFLLSSHGHRWMVLLIWLIFRSSFFFFVISAKHERYTHLSYFMFRKYIGASILHPICLPKGKEDKASQVLLSSNDSQFRRKKFEAFIGLLCETCHTASSESLSISLKFACSCYILSYKWTKYLSTYWLLLKIGMCFFTYNILIYLSKAFFQDGNYLIL